MNWDTIQGNWLQMKGSIKERWGDLTDDDLQELDGRKDQVIGKIQERYGMAREDAEREIDDWLRTRDTAQR
jgi:uncharacterized protein YjbJ (UPF0337 family)